MFMLFVLFACSATPEEVPAPTPSPAPAPEAAPAPKEDLGRATKKEFTDADCNATLVSAGGKEGDVLKVRCADGCTTGTVYGTDVYTGDSRLCTAGVHAGAIEASGGVFKAKVEGKRAEFEASTRNGIESRAWSSEWSPTFRVQGKGNK